jgi:hypothetical protein
MTRAKTGGADKMSAKQSGNNFMVVGRDVLIRGKVSRFAAAASRWKLVGYEKQLFRSRE